MSTEQFEEVRAFHKSQLDAVAQAALTATEHMAKAAEVQLQASKDLIGVLQSHGQQLLSAQDASALAQAQNSLIQTLTSNSVRVAQDLAAIGSEYVKTAKEQATTVVSQNASKAGEAGKAVQAAFVQGAQQMAAGKTAASK